MGPSNTLVMGSMPCPGGWRLVDGQRGEAIRHPRDGHWGALVQHRTTGIYAHLAAGVVRSLPQAWAAAEDNRRAQAAVDRIDAAVAAADARDGDNPPLGDYP